MGKLRDFLLLMRPHQWLKNGFVLVGLLFGHAWNDQAMVLSVALAVGAFSLFSSSVYVVNDLADAAADRLHPRKKGRPLAAGRLAPAHAAIFGAVLALVGVLLGYAASGRVLLILLAYGVLNLAYTLRLKAIVILDVFCIAAGFMLRILAGTIGIGIPPSEWLLLCGLMLTLFLGFAKRRAEMALLEGSYLAHRAVFQHYSLHMLDTFITITATMVLISYSLYTMSPHTAAAHGTTGLIFTVPFIVYGIFRYVLLLSQGKAGSEPALDLIRDPHLVAVLLAWLATTLWLIA